MKPKFLKFAAGAILVIAAVPAMASGLGPAPFYRPDVGASASQPGQSNQTIANERAQENGTDTAVGGVAAGKSDSGRPTQGYNQRSLYAGH